MRDTPTAISCDSSAPVSQQSGSAAVGPAFTLRLCLTSLVWPLLATMRAEEREAFLSLARPRTFVRNEVVCHEGDPADSLHLVESGHLAVRSGLATGVTATLTILSSGDYF